MKLYHSPASPYVRKVVVLLHELGRAGDVALKTISTTAFATDEGLKSANPLGRIPALERDDGVTLYDSRVITAYLNETFGGSLYPTGGNKWELLTLEATGDGIMDCAVSMSYETRLRPEGERSEAWVEAQWAKADRALTALNARWMSHLSGPLSVAHISVGCALGYLDLRHDVRGWRQGRDALAKWFESFAERPSMQATRVS